jgi:hypothetical protein
MRGPQWLLVLAILGFALAPGITSAQVGDPIPSGGTSVLPIPVHGSPVAASSSFSAPDFRFQSFLQSLGFSWGFSTVSRPGVHFASVLRERHAIRRWTP